ncbi:MAG: hypothetical protein IK083_09155 [Abditibacteriota bacterium]|nr:hypothetical protein [Abditibacteriota bacterium]
MIISRLSLYKVIKDRWLRLHPGAERPVFRGDAEDCPYKTRMRDFYFIRRDDNLLQSMSPDTERAYREGDGGELEEYVDKHGSLQPPKLHSVASSSALTFNIFGNGPEAVFAGDLRESSAHSYPPAADSGPEGGPYRIEYEKKLRVLWGSNRPANLDAYLYDGKNGVFVETKLSEWLCDPPKVLDHAYGDPSRYPAGLFEALAPLRKRVNSRDFRRLDAAQLYRHIIGIFNERCYLGGLPGTLSRITLALCYWAPEPEYFAGTDIDPRHYEAAREELIGDCALFTDRLAASSPSVFDLFGEKGVRFGFAAIPADRLAGLLQREDPAAYSEFMKRYGADTGSPDGSAE